MRVIYIAGPFSGDIVNNICAAVEVADKLRSRGLTVICPHENGLHNNKLGLPYEYWIRSTLEIMRRCDAVQLVHGWQKSSVAHNEVAEANILNMPVFNPCTLEPVIRWALK